MDRKLMILVIVALLMGYLFVYGIGFSHGSYKTMVLGLKIGSNFMNITIDEEMIAAGILQYKNNINGCFASPEIETIQNDN